MTDLNIVHLFSASSSSLPLPPRSFPGPRLRSFARRRRKVFRHWKMSRTLPGLSPRICPPMPRAWTGKNTCECTTPSAGHKGTYHVDHFSVARQLYSLCPLHRGVHVLLYLIPGIFGIYFMSRMVRILRRRRKDNPELPWDPSADSGALPLSLRALRTGKRP